MINGAQVGIMFQSARRLTPVSVHARKAAIQLRCILLTMPFARSAIRFSRRLKSALGTVYRQDAAHIRRDKYKEA